EKNILEAEFMICRDTRDMEKYAPQTEIALVGMTFPHEFFDRMPKLEWIQAMAAGVEPYMKNPQRFKGIPVCRITGAFGKYMSEYVMAYIFYLCQDIARVVKAQKEKKWDPFRMEFIHQKTLGVMGLGHIGKAVARRASDAGMRVISWDMASTDAPYVQRQFKADEMAAFLNEADFVVLSVPATPATSNLADRKFFEGMKKTAYLINICRGAVVDEIAMMDALKSGRIAGAVVDAFREEPLPPESPLWDCPNLIVTPHISGPSLPADMVEIFKENFRRFVNKEPLIGLIDFSRGF
ncbi:MAG TPA: D-2-hydroxyacid dehydrogenase, partial [Thermodesulfobacteriota bacterium]|nr:D-2-hydroxyacid dehydrogenase [Thermodesulfobacteriota bacterium]